MIRTHTCGQLRAEHIGQEVTLCGWVDSYRDHGGGIFIDLRDRYGKTQIVFGPESGAGCQELARTLRSEFVVSVTGTVAHRPEGTVNPKLATGEIEVRPSKLVVLNKSATPPFQPGGKELPNEDLRLKYRYLDLRRTDMQQAMLLRHRIIRAMRDLFRRARLHRRRNADARPQHARRGPRLSRAQPRPQRQVLRPAAVAAALQADPDDRRLRSLRAGGPLLSRRRPAGGSPARVHAVRPGDVVRRGRRRDRPDRRAGGAAGRRAVGPAGYAAAAADDVRRSHGALRPRRARLAIRHGAGRLDGPGKRGRIPRFSRGGRGRRARARHQCQGGGGQLLAQGDRRADELRRARFRRQGPGLVQSRRGPHAGLADRQEFHPGTAGPHRRADERRAGRLAAVRGRPVRGHLQGPLRSAQAVRRRAEALRPRDEELFLGRRVPDVRFRRRNRWLGRHAPPVHRPATAGLATVGHAIRASAGRRLTTW